MTYRVEPTAQAEADIDRIFVWLSKRSLDGARRWYESLWECPLSVVSGQLLKADHMIGWLLYR